MTIVIALSYRFSIMVVMQHNLIMMPYMYIVILYISYWTGITDIVLYLGESVGRAKYKQDKFNVQ